MAISVYAMTSKNWARTFAEKGQSSHILSYWLDGLYKNKSIWQRHIAPKLIEELELEFDFREPAISKILESSDGTVKFQVRFQDGMEIETVLIPFQKRYTVCLSTQVGCGMNCSFCYTGTQGLKRNLSAGEIVSQYRLAANWLQNKFPKTMTPNIVFMGQGEPLHNPTEVQKAIEVLNDSLTLGVSQRQMTLSTVGFLPGLQKLKTFTNVNMALSLHSPFQQQREELIPISQKYPLSEVMKALDEIPLLKRQFITFEYLLLKDYNMSDEHVEGLHSLLSHRKAIVNLIPFNPFPGTKWKRPSDFEIEEFKQKLVAKKLRVMVRTTKGDDILAACGQLKINKLARNYAVTT